MAGEQKRKARSLLVTKALLLGYDIPFLGAPVFQWGLVAPDGKPVPHRGVPRGMRNAWPSHMSWPAPWLAAEYALKLAGVIDETSKPRGDLGAGSGKDTRLCGTKRQRAGLKGVT